DEASLRSAVKEALVLGHGTFIALLNVTTGTAKDIEKRRAKGINTKAKKLTFSTKRACPNCGTSFPEPDPRLFSYNSRHGWCKSCFGTGIKLKGFTADQTGEEKA